MASVKKNGSLELKIMKKLVFFGRKKQDFRNGSGKKMGGILLWRTPDQKNGRDLTLENPRSNIGGILFHSNIYIC